jgi:hypothetical protein
MKKLILLFVTLIFIASCTPEESDTVPFHMEFVPVHDFQLPDYVMRGYQYDVIVTYLKPTDCHYFQGFYIDPQGPVITIAPQAMVIEDNDCMYLDSSNLEEESFEFTCENTYPYNNYIFKFYQGEDQMGQPVFYEREVPIVQ